MVFKCQADSFLKEVNNRFHMKYFIKILPQLKWYGFKFQSKVVLCEPTAITQKNFEGKDAIINGFNVVLEDTILFPEGGGQVW